MASDAHGDDHHPSASVDDDQIRRIKRVDVFYDYRTYSYREKRTAKSQKPRIRDGDVLVVKKMMDYKGQHEGTQTEIVSPELAKLFEELYPDSDILERRTPMVADEKLFYHSYAKLRERVDTEKAKDNPDEKLCSSLMTALDYVQSDYGSTMASMDTLLKGQAITFELIWALFPPNTLVYHFHELTQQHQVLRARDAVLTYDGELGIKFWNVICDIVIFNGHQLGLAEVGHLRIDQFTGPRKVQELVVHPLRLRENHVSILAHAVARGQQYCTYTTAKSVECEGPAMYEVHMEGSRTRPQKRQLTFPAFGRGMIDARNFRTFEPNATYDYKIRKPLGPALSDEEYAMCNPVVLGFSFSAKRWGGLGMDYCREPKWRDNAFDSLVLDDSKKILLRSLLTQHKSREFDDVVAGKGKGLIGLLCGGPGCGKTLTAESIAEESRRPLYSISVGELGTTASDVDKRLVEILELAYRWNAILLLDEADVFLHKRSDTDVARNALTSVFLRQLEYYKGILILTTNRLGVFDSAFESRIHFSLLCPDLDAKARKILLRGFLERFAAAARTENLVNEPDLDELTKHDLNGRQIRNLISNALSIALYKKSPLDIGHVRTALKIVEDWNDAVKQRRNEVGNPIQG